jgi:hypothetical protein
MCTFWDVLEQKGKKNFNTRERKKTSMLRRKRKSFNGKERKRASTLRKKRN